MPRRRRTQAARENGSPYRVGAGASPTNRSLLLAGCGVAVAIALYYIFASVGVVNQALREATGDSAVLLLRWLGWPAAREGALIVSGGATFLVATSATPLAAIALVTGATLALRASPLSKLLCVLIGGALLFALNGVRVASLVYMGDRLTGHVAEVHLLVWQALIVLAALIIWLLWADRYALKQGR